MRKVALNSVCKIIGGYAFKSSLMQSTPEKYQVVKMSNLYRGDFDLSRNSSYLKEINDRERHFLLKDGDILITLTGTVGKRDYGYSVLVKNSHNLLLNQRVCLIRPDHSRTDARFLLSVLQSRRFLDLFFASSIGGTGNQTNVSIVDLGELQINIPESLGEQKQIADYFETWNAAIEKTEALIDAKERQFGWLQNELMRKNSQGWTLKSLKDISSIKKGQQVNRDTLDEVGDYPVWNGGISPSGYTDKSNAKAGAITISEGGNSCGFVNFCKVDFWLGGHCYAIENLDSSINPDFLFFFLKSMERKIMQLRVGSGLPNIQRKDIEKLQIYFPALEEQKSITTSLSIAKKEISLLKELVVQYRAQKRGLMQRLLI